MFKKILVEISFILIDGDELPPSNVMSDRYLWFSSSKLEVKIYITKIAFMVFIIAEFTKLYPLINSE